MRIITFNIRFDNPLDRQNAWPHRKQAVAQLLQRYQPDIAGLQEAFKHQIDDLTQNLPDYAWFGAAREDGREAGEFNPVFYRPSRLALRRQETFWLSETPQRPGSRDWDADCTRIVTWAEFATQTDARRLFFFNTHFDNVGAHARRQSAHLLLQKIRELAGDQPAIVTGDFNCTPDSPPIRILTQPHASGAPLLINAQHLAHQPHSGPSGTFNVDFTGQVGDRIDYIFVSPTIQVTHHAILTDNSNGRYPSDHFPVLADLRLEDEEPPRGELSASSG